MRVRGFRAPSSDIEALAACGSTSTPGSAQVWNYLENVRDLDTHAKITLTQ